MTTATGTPMMNPTAVPICPHLPTSSVGLRIRSAPVTKPEAHSPTTASIAPTPSRIRWIVLNAGINRGAPAL
jgi:hypothetical protein